jgi:hypothetical protein
MRKPETNGRNARNSSSAPKRTRRSALIATIIPLGVALAMTAGAAQAADDGDEKSFSDKFIDGIKSSVRGTSIDDGKIQYRERSPLVVPPRLDLPPPDVASGQAKAANWPKDPDEGRRRPTAAEKKKNKPGIIDTVLKPFLPSKPADVASAVPEEPSGPLPPPRPGNATDKDNPIYDQAGDLFKTDGITSRLGLSDFNLFGSSKPQAAQFKGEPTRETLTQPPPGYQVPSPIFAYGVNVKTEVFKPVDINSAGERYR